MADLNFIDFYIEYPGHPRFVEGRIIEDDIIRVIVQKYEVLIFTNKGELLGDPNFGCDLVTLLFQTKVSADTVKKIVLEQILTYIPEITDTNFTLDVQFYNDPENYQDQMEINFTIADYEVYAIVG